MNIIADLEVHSKYARAVSPSMNVPTIALWADKKGIDLVGSGDFTHPMWLRELESQLEEDGDGIYKLKNSATKSRFLLTSEVSCIYTHNGKGRRVHIMVYLPSFSSVRAFNEELTKRGANLFSDGRPIIGLTLTQVAEIALTVDKRALIIPAHVWTPWFGFYGSMSGYDSLSEAFGNLEKYIPAVETGLSSDPAANWRIGELAGKRIVSFGDAHSPQKLGREATVFQIKNSKLKITYQDVYDAIWNKTDGGWEIAYTIEFYPEEGKYHYTGHRSCNIVYSPNEARKWGMTCPTCGRQLTMGVMSRVEALSSQEITNDKLQITNDKLGVAWIRDEKGKYPPYVMLVPLLEILSEALIAGVGSQTVINVYEQLIHSFESEFNVLLKTEIADIAKMAGQKISEAIQKVRSGDIFIKPGYDGVFGTVKIWKEEEEKEMGNNQASLF
ncbi:hypothetical protein A2962_04110 [Candidatus Woesebacteria bacterium RIFCSPLOWO2_01_FULL_39_61]|uniref:DNA helicase UvrD n=1 Tax=Candidatus Woesebacteria bacterium RIFCSPHIGHO2_02_FULL_39_13 TaxID=1802505 RepID=A0A1F7YXQ8_9BACT|nr:MAG: hypothetical protein A2692_00465 [Candidatus Woesebacteria bacterium RIFCSPHIGHO2_01_FULL_39_95]OGM32146.1 MAG: hypothetical protein A3D01_02045 [Candidatus Woesebacteria bacterium RIFCSPHIGHO2_02_FULL_39_13]OGM36596.1 MAG: hypothetical protein A3E13_02885 [Candidatus Woesebacteria bacterium RIFCSPHIGHO2_12_FULL_40_20]OGM65937.1 MAG: hypothetical protein A2962_04110 [Candidatus Woesebacteria bacterium RIFCSPLOWO2_01_FULL_39_61]OGM71422.1 MAG: hypothetical protein A3H19_04625 [Candidatus